MPITVLPLLAHAALDRALDLLAPPRCAACDERLERRAVFCAPCAATVDTVAAVATPGGLAEVVAASVYGGAVARAIQAFKFEGRPDRARPLGELLRAAVRRSGLRADVVVPVPLHPRRLVERGYDQAALLAAIVAGELDAKLAVRALARTRDLPKQSRLGRAERARNVEGAFVAPRSDGLAGRHVVVVDDVVTTGATFAACASALRSAGAARVTAVALAAALDPDVTP